MPPLRGGDRGVPIDPFLGGLLDHRRHIGPELIGLTDHEHADRAGDPLDELVGDRLVHEHPRGRRALLTGVHERRGDDPGDRLVQIRVRVDDHAVLAAELRHHALQMPLSGRDLRRRAGDLHPDRHRPGERDRVHPGVGHERRAGVALSGQQRDRRRRHSAGAERLHEHQRASRRLLGRLEHDRVAGGERRGGHPARDRDREVPGRDHRHHAAWSVPHLVSLAGDL